VHCQVWMQVGGLAQVSAGYLESIFPWQVTEGLAVGMITGIADRPAAPPVDGQRWKHQHLGRRGTHQTGDQSAVRLA
jgi:hypothetical protein